MPLFEQLESSARIALFALFAIHLPPEIRQNKFELPPGSWSETAINKLLTELELSDSYMEAYLPMIPSNCECLSKEELDGEKSMSTSLMKVLESSNVRGLPLLIDLIIFLFANDLYDGRGRTIIRKISRTIFSDLESTFLAIEYHIAGSLETVREVLTHSIQKADNRKKMIRYAKIGAASVVAGTLLAVTGGIAAPAIAGAFVVMGGTRCVSM